MPARQTVMWGAHQLNDAGRENVVSDIDMAQAGSLAKNLLR